MGENKIHYYCTYIFPIVYKINHNLPCYNFKVMYDRWLFLFYITAVISFLGSLKTERPDCEKKWAGDWQSSVQKWPGLVLYD